MARFIPARNQCSLQGSAKDCTWQGSGGGKKEWTRQRLGLTVAGEGGTAVGREVCYGTKLQEWDGKAEQYASATACRWQLIGSERQPFPYFTQSRQFQKQASETLL